MPTVTNIGTASSTLGATVTLTTGVAIPTGATVVVAVNDASSGPVGGAMTDSQGNSYVSQLAALLNNNAASGFVQIFLGSIVAPLATTDTITYTIKTTNAACCLSAFFMRGTLGLIDPAAAAVAFGTSAAPSVTSGVPHSGSWFFAVAGYANNSLYTQDAGHGWATPFAAANAGATRGLGGGNQLGGASAIAFSPTISAVGDWAALVAGLQPPISGWEQQGRGEAQPLKMPPRTMSALKHRVGFAYTAGYQPLAEVYLPPSTAPWLAPRNRAAHMDRRDLDFAPPRFFPPGYELGGRGEFNPPHPRPERSGAIAMGDSGRQLIQTATILPSMSWPEPPMHKKQTPCLDPALRGDDGIVYLFQPTVLPITQWPYEIVRYLTPKRVSVLSTGEDVGKLTQSPQVIQPSGVDPTLPLLARVNRTLGTLVEPRTDFFLRPWQNVGFDQVSVQEPRRRWEKTSGALARWIDGTLIGTAAPVVPWWEQTWPQPPHPKWRSPEIGDRGAYGVFVPPGVTPFFWWDAIQPPQPPQPRTKFGGAIMVGDLGNQNVKPPAVSVPFSWRDQLDVLRRPPTMKALSALRTRYGFAVFPPWVSTSAFEVAPVQPPFWLKPRQKGAAKTRHAFVAFPKIVDGWPTFLPSPLAFPRPRLAGALARGHDGNEQPFQFILPTVAWPEPPMHKNPSPRRAGGIVPRDDGIYAPFVPPVLVATAWWDDRLDTWRKPFVATGRAGAVMRGDDGTTLPLVTFIPPGGAILPWQPPHPRFERAGVLARGVDANDFPFTVRPSAFFDWPVPMIWRPPTIRREGAILRGLDAIESPRPRLLPYGWEIAPVQPPRAPRVVRYAALALGDPGNYRPLIRFVPLLQEHTPETYFRRPQAHVPVFLLQSLESYATFTPPHPPASAHTRIVGYGMTVTVVAMEREVTIIDALKPVTTIVRQDT